MAENAATLRVAAAPGGRSREIRLVDLPGHPRLRGRLDAFAPAARALVFVVDGRDGVFIPGCRATAECVAF
jgi:signal recognition particle receptor subunit beta